MRRRALLNTAASLGALGTLDAVLSTGRPAAQESSFAPLGSVSVPKAKEVVVDAAGTHAYVATTDGFSIIDLADPSAPVVIFEQSTIGADQEAGPVEQIHDVKLDEANDLLVATGAAQGGGTLDGVAVFDVSVPTAPERICFFETPFFNHNCDIDAGIVHLCGNDFITNGLVSYNARTGERLGDWSIVSVDDRWQDVSFGNWNLHDVHVSDGVAYLAHWDAGTWMVDVSDPTTPELIARIRGRSIGTFLNMAGDEARREAIEPPGNDHTAVPDQSGDLLGIGVESWDAGDDESGGPGGIHLYNISDVSTPTKHSTLLPPAGGSQRLQDGEGEWTTSHNFELSNGLGYSSWYSGGVRLHDISDPSEPRLLGAWRSEDTTFWSAQAATEAFFVASSYLDPTADRRRQGARLYTFPVIREQVTSPDATVMPTSSSSKTATTTPTTTATSTPTTTVTPSPTATATSNRTPTSTESADLVQETPDGSSAEGPGFGLWTAVLAVGLGVARYLLRGRRDDDT
jgi:hypothetical protein